MIPIIASGPPGFYMVPSKLLFALRVPWYPALILEFEQSSGLGRKVLRVRNIDSRLVASIKDGMLEFETEIGLEDNLGLSDAEHLCLRSIPREAAMRTDISKIMKDSFWQHVLDMILVEDVLST